MSFDQYGRYLIRNPDSGQVEPYTRVTTFAKTLDDTFGLLKWEQRMAAIGLSRRADLLAQVAAARDDDATRLDTIIKDAREAGEASKGANIGQALHEFTERVDGGELDLAAVPEPWRADVAAYRAEMERKGLAVKLIEATVVIPELGVAGTLDRLVLDDSPVLIVLDVKTGQRLWLLTIAIQMALYAHARSIYDLDTDTHSPMPEVDQKVGYVAHMPAGHGSCRIIPIDLEVGWRGAQLAAEVRAWRKSSVELTPPEDPRSSLERRMWLPVAVKRLVTDFPEAAGDLARRWPIGVPTIKQAKATGQELTPDELDAIARVVAAVEADHRVPFGLPDPAHVLPPKQQRNATQRKEAS